MNAQAYTVSRPKLNNPKRNQLLIAETPKRTLRISADLVHEISRHYTWMRLACLEQARFSLEYDVWQM